MCHCLFVALLITFLVLKLKSIILRSYVYTFFVCIFSGVKNGGCCSYGGLIDVLPSQDWQVAALWNYRKEIMEPCLKNFVGSFGESGRID